MRLRDSDGKLYRISLRKRPRPLELTCISLWVRYGWPRWAIRRQSVRSRYTR